MNRIKCLMPCHAMHVEEGVFVSPPSVMLNSYTPVYGIHTKYIRRYAKGQPPHLLSGA